MSRKSGTVRASTTTIEYSPQLVRRMERARKRTEDRWASMAGPVTVRRVDGASATGGAGVDGRDV